MSSTKDPQRSLEYWRSLVKLGEDLKADANFAQTFRADPASVLRDRGLDVDVPSSTDPSGATALSDLLDRMTPEERAATADAVTLVSNMDLEAEAHRVAIVVPLANVNVVANHNVAANTSAAANAVATANALAVQNTTGTAATESHVSSFVSTIVPVSLPEEFGSSEAAEAFGRLDLNESRQKALLKRAVTDDDSIIARRVTPGGEYRKARYAFRGTLFEVDAIVTEGDITVLNARVINTPA